MPDPKLHINTVATTMRRLADKGFLKFEDFGSTYRYSATISKKEYTNRFVKPLLASLFGNSIKNVVAFLFLAYWVLLRKLKFFRLNRLFFLGSLLLALLLPLIPPAGNRRIEELNKRFVEMPIVSAIYNRPVELAGGVVMVIGSGPQAPLAAPVPSYSASQWAMGIYMAVSLIFCTLLLFRILRLLLLIRRCRRWKEDGVNYCEPDCQISPFSFFNYLVINEAQYNFDPEQLRQVIAHEKAHIDGGHTIDILFSELMHAFLWINPVVLVLKRFIKLNLEYIADERVLDCGVNRKTYQLNILNSALHGRTYPIANLFNSSKLKLRIKMMNTKTSPARSLYKYILVLPLLLATYLTVNTLSALALKSSGMQSGKLGIPVKFVRDTAGDYKAFSGIFKHKWDDGSDGFVELTATDTGLVLKQLWDGKQIPFVPSTSLSFFNREHPEFTLVFTKDADGTINQFLAFGKDAWARTTEKPVAQVVRAAVQVPPLKLKALEGKYKLEGKDTFIQLTGSENGLVLAFNKDLWDKVL
jgi:hypothetical protein